MYREEHTCAHFGGNIVLLTYMLLKMPWNIPCWILFCLLTTMISVHAVIMSPTSYLPPCSALLCGLFSNAKRGKLTLPSSILKFYAENFSVDGEYTNDWHLRMLLDTKWKLWAKNQHVGRIKWNNVCESACKLQHANSWPNDTVDETS